jgi:predicted GTPase
LVALSYSDISHVEVMHKASLVMANGADFILIGATYTMLRSRNRDGRVRSQDRLRKISDHAQGLRYSAQAGKKVVAVRHPMPYGDLRTQVVQRFSSYEDFERHHCTIEEREEYEPLVEQGIVVYAGVDYAEILEAAERRRKSSCGTGGTTTRPFYAPDAHIVLFDPHRPGHELLYYPGETNMLMADIAIINKVDTAPAENVEKVRQNILIHAPKAEIVTG